jgi:hypothetical protein
MAAAKAAPNPNFQNQGITSRTAWPPISDHAVKIATSASRYSQTYTNRTDFAVMLEALSFYDEEVSRSGRKLQQRRGLFPNT